MGAALQTAGAAELAAELTCCACSSVCGLVARNASTRAKFRYWSLLLMATVTCIVLLVPGIRQIIYRIPNFCNKVVSIDTCDKLIGFNAVYRILFSLTMFHFLLAIFTLRVDRVKTCRARFNNGLWMFKVGLILGITVGSFYIPKQTGFFRIWMYVSLTGGFMFAMFQIILVIDFGHSWSLSWANKLEHGYTKLWYAAMTMVTFVLFAMSGCAVVSFYYFFTHPPDVKKCHANVFYIGFISIQCFIASIVSVMPTIQRELAGAGLLQSAVVILYTMYLTFNTLIAEPDSYCNPLGSIIVEYDTYTGVSGQTIFGCMVTLALLVFAFTVRTDTSYLGKYGLALAESDEFALDLYHDDKNKEGVEQKLETGGKEVLLDEYVGYNYSFFHLIMSLASLHILMVITNWHSPDDNSNNLKRLVKNWASVWVQMASSFVCVLVYIWFLVTPLIKTVWGPLFGVYPASKPRPKKPGKSPKDDRSGGGSKSSKSIDPRRQIEEISFSPAIHNASRARNNERNHDNDERSRKPSQPEKHNQQKKIDDHHLKRQDSLDSLDSLNSEGGAKKRMISKHRSHNYDSNGSVVSILSDAVSRTRQGVNRHNTTNDRRQQKLDDFRFRQRKKYPESPLYLSQRSRHEHSTDITKDFPRINRSQTRGQDTSRDNQGHDLTRNTRDVSKDDRGYDQRRNTRDISKDNQGHDLGRNTRDLSKDNRVHDLARNSREISKDDRGKDLTKNTRDISKDNRGYDHTNDQDRHHDFSNEIYARNDDARAEQKEDRTGDKGLQGHEPVNSNPVTKTQTGDNTNISRLKLEAENSLLQQRINEYNSSVHALSIMAESCESIRPPASSFGRRPQNPEVAKEILKLQWKILRSQAKMVKIQERIIRLQHAAAENENAVQTNSNLQPGITTNNNNVADPNSTDIRNKDNTKVQEPLTNDRGQDSLLKSRLIGSVQCDDTSTNNNTNNLYTKPDSNRHRSAHSDIPSNTRTGHNIEGNEGRDGEREGRGRGGRDRGAGGAGGEFRGMNDGKINSRTLPSHRDDEKDYRNDTTRTKRNTVMTTAEQGRNWESERRIKELG